MKTILKLMRTFLFTTTGLVLQIIIFWYMSKLLYQDGEYSTLGYIQFSVICICSYLLLVKFVYRVRKFWDEIGIGN